MRIMGDLRGLQVTIRDFLMGSADCKGVLVTFSMIAADYLMG